MKQTDNDDISWVIGFALGIIFTVITVAIYTWHTIPVNIIVFGEKICAEQELDYAGYHLSSENRDVPVIECRDPAEHVIDGIVVKVKS